MIYRHINSGELYQYIGAGRMALTAPLDCTAHCRVVLVRDPHGRNHVFAKEEQFPAHWTVRSEASLLANPGRTLYDDDEVVIYRAEDGRWMVSPAEEFFDGRYVAFSA